MSGIWKTAWPATSTPASCSGPMETRVRPPEGGVRPGSPEATRTVTVIGSPMLRGLALGVTAIVDAARDRPNVAGSVGSGSPGSARKTARNRRPSWPGAVA
ncbi:hypothetical protein [Paludisphaera soli]|uniref:hypothetical protein n=1 Tax=Paludisphaera soli TaxID=2712865 RepID=UPI0013EB8786|nr:hypothetical protein [Paludisphaera soli]